MRMLRVEGFGNFTYGAIALALTGFGASGTILSLLRKRIKDWEQHISFWSPVFFCLLQTPCTSIFCQNSPYLLSEKHITAVDKLGLADSPWPMYRHDPQHTGRSEYTGPEYPKQVWRYKIGDVRVSSSPVIGVDGTIYVKASNGYLYAITQSGNLKWKFRANRGITSSPAVDEGLVFVGSTDWNVYALDARTGWAVWRCRTNNALISSPAISEGCLYIGSVDGNLYAIETQSGRLIWKFSAEGQITSSPKVAEGAVYFGANDQHVYSVDVETGKVRWSFKTGGPVPSSPSVANGIVYIGSTDNKVYALPM